MSESAPLSARAKFIARRIAVAAAVIGLLWLIWPGAVDSDNPYFLPRLLHLLPVAWIDFLKRVGPDVKLNGSAVALAIIVAGLAFALAHSIGRRCSRGWSWRSTIGLVLAPAVLFVIVLAAVGIATRTTELARDPDLVGGGFRRFKEPPPTRQAIERERRLEKLKAKEPALMKRGGSESDLPSGH